MFDTLSISNMVDIQSLLDTEKSILESRIDCNNSTEYTSTCLNIVKFYYESFQSGTGLNQSNLRKAFEFADKALIIGGPNEELFLYLKFFNSCIPKFAKFINILTADTFPRYEKSDIKIKDPIIPIPTLLNEPSISEFKRVKGSPIKIIHALESWPAIHKWKSPKFWCSIGGHRTFVAEIGSDYLDENWTQNFITLSDYFNQFVFTPKPAHIAYIAQQNFTLQLPELLADFAVPELCDFAFSLHEESSTIIQNFWFGMRGTLTPLHFDNYENFFCQVVGIKRLVLVSPRFSEKLQRNAGNAGNTENTCHLCGDELQHVLAGLPHYEFILNPGDMLYIPRGFWHQVTSESFSISINFWF